MPLNKIVRKTGGTSDQNGTYLTRYACAIDDLRIACLPLITVQFALLLHPTALYEFLLFFGILFFKFAQQSIMFLS